MRRKGITAHILSKIYERNKGKVLKKETEIKIIKSLIGLPNQSFDEIYKMASYAIKEGLDKLNIYASLLISEGKDKEKVKTFDDDILNLMLTKTNFLKLNLTEEFLKVKENYEKSLIIFRFLNIVSDDQGTVDKFLMLKEFEKHKKEGETHVEKAEFEETCANINYSPWQKVLQDQKSLSNSIDSLFKSKTYRYNFSKTKVKIDGKNAFIYNVEGIEFTVPAITNGYYHLGGHQFIMLQNQNSINGMRIRPSNPLESLNALQQIFYISKIIIDYYDYKSEEGVELLCNLFQKGIDSLFYQKFTRFDESGNIFEWIDPNLSDEEKEDLHYKITFYESKNVDAPVLNKFGLVNQNYFGYKVNLKLTETIYNNVDPTGLNNVGSFATIYNNEERVTRAELHNPLVWFDKEPYRIALIHNMLKKATDIVLFDIVEMDLNVNGLTTFNGGFIHQSNYKSMEKVALDGYFKGVSMPLYRGNPLVGDVNKDISNLDGVTKVYYIDNNGEERIVSIMNESDSFKRGIVSNMISGINKFSNTEKLVDPEELFEENIRTIYARFEDGSSKALCQRVIQTLNVHLIREPDFSWGFKFGVELINRIEVEGLTALLDELLPNVHGKATELYSSELADLHGKYGKINQSYNYASDGIILTAFQSSKLNVDESIVVLTKKEYRQLLATHNELIYVEGERLFTNNSFIVINPYLDRAAASYVKKTEIIISNFNGIFVNPKVWLLMKRDGDGDTAGIHFFGNSLSEEALTQLQTFHYNSLIELYGEAVTDEEINFALRDGYFTSFKEYVYYFASKAKGEEHAKNLIKWLYPDGKFRVITEGEKRIRLMTLHTVQLTNIASKKMIGFAKRVPMDALMIFKYYVNKNENVSQETIKTFLKEIDDLSNILVQQVIDMLKWSQNYKEVLKTTFLSFAFQDLVSNLFKGVFKYEYRFLKKLYERLKARGIIFKQGKDYYWNEEPFTVEIKDYFDYIINLRKNYKFDKAYVEKGEQPLAFSPSVKDLESFKPYYRVKADAFLGLLNPEGEIYKTLESFIDKNLKTFNFEESYFGTKGAQNVSLIK